ncbi:MAG: SH3 domain-containing protein [Treponema sp.]|nr:SH3 domain-containing protein [Treponema sp.]
MMVLFMMLLSSCARPVGWGLLLWSTEDPAVPSGAVLPVYIKSNINQVWVAGIPEAYRRNSLSTGIDKIELPLSKLDLVGSKRAAEKRAAAFADLALIYGEALQDGLPIRDTPDNSARRVYRLRQGEVIKVLSQVEGTPAISSTGEPLQGVWYEVLTETGSRGYCFSYRLRLFEHAGGPLQIVHVVEAQEDPELEKVLAKTWSPESYGIMLNTRKIDLQDLSRQWRFTPGQDTGIAHLYLPTLDKAFSYTSIRSEGDRSWRFEGAPLQMRLRSDTTLEVQFTENGSALRTLLFVALPQAVEDIIIQETARRDQLFRDIYDRGPVFHSDNYGTLSFFGEGTFSWRGYELLIPWVIPATAQNRGTLSMDLFLDPELEHSYNGAFSLYFDGPGGPLQAVQFLYTLEPQGFRIEYIPPANLYGVTVTRRAGSPMVIYFSKAAS